MTGKSYATDVNVTGGNIVITVGTEEKVIPFTDINLQYAMREFARGLKLRIDNASAGTESDEGKLKARLDMFEKIDFSDPSGGISGGRKKESGEAFLARYVDAKGKSKITSIEDYQNAVNDAKSCVRKDEQSDVFVELSMTLSDLA